MNAVTNEADIETVSGRIRLQLGSKSIDWVVAVPTQPVSLDVVLPTLFDLCNQVVTVVEEEVSANGLKISCTKGCGACCSQLVPVSPSEARWIRRLVERLPDERRQIISERFARASQRLQEAGLRERLVNPDASVAANPAQLGMQYFGAGVACPFLEEGCCSIHVDRPTACREFLVTSPAINCSNPNPIDVKSVEVPVRVSRIVAELDDNRPAPTSKPRWVALALALDDDVESTGPTAELRTGPEWIEAALAKLR